MLWRCVPGQARDSPVKHFCPDLSCRLTLWLAEKFEWCRLFQKEIRINNGDGSGLPVQVSTQPHILPRPEKAPHLPRRAPVCRGKARRPSIALLIYAPENNNDSSNQHTNAAQHIAANRYHCSVLYIQFYNRSGNRRQRTRHTAGLENRARWTIPSCAANASVQYTLRATPIQYLYLTTKAHLCRYVYTLRSSAAMAWSQVVMIIPSTRYNSTASVCSSSGCSHR